MIDFSANLPQATAMMMIGAGLLAFLSPCVLPMLPVYGLYLLGGDGSEEGRAPWGLAIRRCLGLAASFIVLFTLMGAGAGLLGSALKQLNPKTLKIISGGLMIVFGLVAMGVLRLPSIGMGRGGHGKDQTKGLGGFFGAFGFGLVMALSWTPCMTPLLAGALVQAASVENATMLTGMGHLALFAFGLCLPMMVFLVLYQWLKGTLGWLRQHQPLLRRIGGGLMTGYGVYLIVSALV